MARHDDRRHRGVEGVLAADGRVAQRTRHTRMGGLEVLEHMKQRAALTSRLLVQAIVLNSLIQRTLFYGINLMFPNPFPSKVFADPDDARRWLEATLRT